MDVFSDMYKKTNFNMDLKITITHNNLIMLEIGFLHYQFKIYINNNKQFIQFNILL